MKENSHHSEPTDTEVNRGIDMSPLEAYVVSAISRYRNRNDILVHICESTGWDWDRALEFYDRTTVKHAEALDRSRRRVHAIAGLLLCLIGGCELLAVASLIAYCSRSGGALNYGCDIVFHGESFLALLLFAVVQGLAFFVTGVVGLGLYISRLFGEDDSRLTDR